MEVYMETQERITKINELFQLSEDAKKGYRLAATEVDQGQFKNVFRLTAQQRASYATLWKEELQNAGTTPVKDGTGKGRIHRAWMQLRNRLHPHDYHSVMTECARGEEEAMKVYTDIFENKLLPELEPILHEQFVSIIEMRDWLMADKMKEGVWSGKTMGL
jgi:uncharacterized protein (TIGR02284 family)